MITKNQAERLRHGQTIYCNYAQNADGTPCRFRVSGQIKTWKTRPEEFKLPIKYGLKGHGYLTQDNQGDFCLTESEAADYFKAHAG